MLMRSRGYVYGQNRPKWAPEACKQPRVGKHVETGSEPFGIVVRWFVGTVPGIVGLAW